MKIDIDRLRYFHDHDALVQGDFGDARETACLMSALTGGTNFGQCAAAGWPQWLAELGATLFDWCVDDGAAWQFAEYFATVVRDADARGVDWNDVFRAIRLDSILPIALAAIGDGDQPWRVQCRSVVQGCIDDGGSTAEAAEAAGAAEAAEAAEAAWAAEAAGAAGAAWAAAKVRITESTLRCIREAPGI